MFQLHGTDANGNKVFSKRLTRGELPKFMAQSPACLVGMEACGSAHHWARKFTKMGHTVKLMNPQYVKPYIKTNKNDANDAEGISEAVTRPTMRFVGIKTIEQQDICMLHRIRERLLKQRTQLQNHIRGLLAEYGIVIAVGIKSLRTKLPEILEDETNELSPRARRHFAELYDELRLVLERSNKYDDELAKVVKEDERCQRLLTVPGVGVISATILVANVGDGQQFRNGRQVASFFGLVPRQCSSGNNQRLLGISKRGDRYIRSLLIHGGRSVVQSVMRKGAPPTNLWLKELVKRVGKNKAAVAVANKNARIIWALLTNKTTYQRGFNHQG